ncbi:hypothetical protein QCA50_002224 [Cerrena zonata]|uniref:Uncharacterized protein n=1 Tax=Cerrena zonata TaxID=2478898 RepID=A0AAW0GQW8_9APHY
MTELEAQVQKSLSMQRYQESQIQEREGEVAALQEKLHLFQTTLQQTEQATKAAEVKFTFQISQDEQTIAGLRREIVSLRGNGALQQTVTELREKNEEMEQLLRAKCLEIEDNDDRFIELIKEKKKLNSKVESLTRKVTNLQAKLAAVPAPAPPSTSAPTPVPVPTSSHAAPAPALSSSLHASSSKAPPPTFTRTPSTPSSSRSRTTSGPSVFSRSKTPEPKIPPPPVFRPRTPESKRLPAIPAQTNSPPPATMYTSSSSTSSGKKRRAPDDFDECEGLPPQVFTSDSMPSHDNEAFTPRVRRALNSVRTGFTPVRGSGLGSRPNPNQLSPRRATTGSPMIADVTNSPRGRKHSENPADKASKRSGWLGKMRGGQGTRSTNALSRPVFERPQNQGAGPAR